MATETLPPDLQKILTDLQQNEQAARSLIAGLSADQLNRQPVAGKSWSILQCLDHLALANNAYLAQMKPVLDATGPGTAPRKGPLSSSFFGNMFVGMLEPPVRFKAPAPPQIVPASAHQPEEVLNRWLASHQALEAIVRAGMTLDLSSLTFQNPFFNSLRMRFSTALRIVGAHERRHLWQAGRIRSSVL